MSFQHCLEMFHFLELNLAGRQPKYIDLDLLLHCSVMIYVCEDWADKFVVLSLTVGLHLHFFYFFT